MSDGEEKKMAEPTKARLARELEAAGLTEMSARAATGYYDDYESELATPCLQLAADLAAAGTPAALALRARHLNGEFDGTREEGEAWYQREGKHALFSDILDRKRK